MNLKPDNLSKTEKEGTSDEINYLQEGNSSAKIQIVKPISLIELLNGEYNDEE